MVLGPRAFAVVGACATTVACSLLVDSSNLSGHVDAPASVPDGGSLAASADAMPQGDGAPASLGYPDLVLSDHPVSYLRFEEPSGSPFARDAVRGVDVDVNGPAKRVTGAIGSGLALSGTESVDFGDVFDFSGLSPFTIEAWVKCAPRAEDQLIAIKRGGDPLLGYILYVEGNAGGFKFEAWGANLSAWGGAPASDAFVHLVVTVSYVGGKGNAALFVNGESVGKGGFDNTDPLPNTPYPFILGSGLVGVLDEVAIYDRALPRERIYAHATAPHP